MASKTIIDLPVLSTATSNTQNTVFVVWDKISGTTKQFTLAALNANTLIYVGTAPSTNKGASGDTKGMVYLANNYFYYCSANYNGTTNVWSRIASSDAW